MVILERNIPIGRKRAREHSDIPKDALKGLVQDIAHLVFEVLRGDERVDQVDAELAFEGNDLAARAADIRVDVERLPEVVDRRRAGHGPHVKQHADVGFEHGPEGVEEPAVRVDLLLVLFFQAEDNLDRADVFP
jgi:hypothetical protein